jgi:hypothetical protein
VYKSPKTIKETNSPAVSGEVHAARLLKRFESLRSLRDNWNGYGAQPIADHIIDRAYHFLLNVTPNQQPAIIVPTGSGTIQMEYEDLDTKYLELEIGDDAITILYKLPGEDEVELENIPEGSALEIIQQYHVR